MILSALGAMLWGYGLLMILLFPREFSDSLRKWNVVIHIFERGIGTGLFLAYGLAIQKNWLKKRYLAWGLFFGTVSFAILSVIVLRSFL